MPAFTDQTGNTIQLDAPPQRILSLVPSQTELLAYLGLDTAVAGITKFCIHPDAWFRSKTRAGGTKQLNMETIGKLAPDLIIANKEENVKEQIEALQRHYQVWISDINNTADALEMIKQIGLITGKDRQATELVSAIEEQFASFSPQKKHSACYLIWQKPYMTIGHDTFIHAMLETAGFCNLYTTKKRYPETTLEELKALRPECLLLSSEPFPFGEKQRQELQNELPGTQVLLVDGEIFSWYGSRLLKAPGYFRQLQEQIN